MDKAIAYVMFENGDWIFIQSIQKQRWINACCKACIHLSDCELVSNLIKILFFYSCLRHFQIELIIRILCNFSK